MSKTIYSTVNSLQLFTVALDVLVKFVLCSFEMLLQLQYYKHNNWIAANHWNYYGTTVYFEYC